MSAQDEFGGKTVVVTGATRGIGSRCARRFAELGARVLACDVDGQGLAALRQTPQPRIEPQFVDVRNEASVRAALALVDDGLDALVNCAGIQRFGDAVDTTLEDWNDVMQVNVTGAFLMSRHAIAPMRRRGGGAIVNVSSIHARLTAGSRVAYVTSKTALLGLTRAMSLDHARDGIRVNVVLPGAIETPMLTGGWAALRPDRTVDEMRSAVAATNPLGRVGTPDDVTEAIVYLTSQRASFVTGAELVVDGGVVNKLSLPVTPASR